MRVRLDDGDVVLTSDACYLRQALENMILPDQKVVRNADRMLRAYKRLRSLKQRGALLMFGPDPAQWQDLNVGQLKENTCSIIRDSTSAHLAKKKAG